MTLLALALVMVAASVMAPSPDPEADVRALLKSGLMDEAETVARALVTRRERQDGPDSLAVARALDLLVEVVWRSHAWVGPEITNLAGRALGIKESILGPDDPEVAASLINLSVLQSRAGSLAEAWRSAGHALAIREQTSGPRDPAVAEALRTTAMVAVYMGDLSEAIAAGERALSIIEEQAGPDSLSAAECLMILGWAIRGAGDYERAASVYERALAIRRGHLPPGHPDIAVTLNALAEAREGSGDFAAAIALIEEARRLTESAVNPDPVRFSHLLHNLGALHHNLGDSGTAGPLLERAHAGFVATVGESHHLTGWSHLRLAEFRTGTGDDESAREHYESATAIFESTFPPHHPLRASARSHHGEMLYRRGDWQAARLMLDKALQEWRRLDEPLHPFAADTCAVLGSTLRDLGEYEQAAPMFEEALEIMGTSWGADHPRYGETLVARARLRWSQGRAAAALQDALAGESILRENVRTVARGLSETEALRYVADMEAGLDLALSIAPTLPPGGAGDGANIRVLEALTRSRALVLDVAAGRARSARNPADPEIAALADAVADSRRRYARMLVHGPEVHDPSSYPERLLRSRTAMESAERALAAKSLAFQKESERPDVSPAILSRLLPARTALVSYVVYRQYERLAPDRPPVRSYAALVFAPPIETPALVPLGPAGTVDAFVERWHKAVSVPPEDTGDDREYRSAAVDLRRAIWDPLASHFAGARTVFVVPDASLHAVSLATLTDATGHYLVENGPAIHYLSAERDLSGAIDPPPRAGGLLVLGGADFDASPDGGPGIADERARYLPARDGGRPRPQAAGVCAGLPGFRFAPLPGSADEAEEIARLWSEGRWAGSTAGATVVRLTGLIATERNLRESAGGKQVLHLATHTFFAPGPCGSDPGVGWPASGGHVQPSTLGVSGLALSGANRRHEGGADAGTDDGILTSEEIASLDLQDTTWAVLSGCSTGAGVVRAGEGILGLRRSFQIAGARTVILSLWPVGDNDAREWMSGLYRARAAGQSTIAAARSAALRIIEARRQTRVSTHPHCWGAIVATGDWR